MSLADQKRQQVQAQQEKQETLERLKSLESQLQSLMQHQGSLAKSLNELVSGVELVNGQMVVLQGKLQSISPKPESDSENTRLAEKILVIEQNQQEIAETLKAIEESLSKNESVQLSDGSEIKRSDVDALTMMKNLSTTQEKMTSSLNKLVTTVGNGRTVKFDTAKLEEHAVKVLDKRLEMAVQPSVDRVADSLKDVEDRVGAVGSEKFNEVTEKAHEVVKAVEGVEGKLGKLESKVTWTAVGRLCLSLLPLAAVLLVVGGLVNATVYALGIDPLLSWAWASFETADVWWAKTLIGLGTLGGVGAFGWIVWLIALGLKDTFRFW